MYSASQEELELVADILTFTNSQDTRILSTDAAVDVFKRSGLSDEELREIWRFADQDRNGRLSSKEIAVAVRLMGWVQVGEPLSENLLELPGPLPTLEGISDVHRTHGPSLLPLKVPLSIVGQTSSRSASPALPAIPFPPPTHSTRTEEPQTSLRPNEASTSRSPPLPSRPLARRLAISEPLASTNGDPPSHVENSLSTSLLAATFLTNPRSEPRSTSETRSETRSRTETHTRIEPRSAIETRSRTEIHTGTEPRSAIETRLPTETPRTETRSATETRSTTETRPPAESRSATETRSAVESRSTNPFLSAQAPAEMREEIKTLKAHLETFRQKNEGLESQIKDMEIAMSQVLLASEHGGFSDEATVTQLTMRIAELEQFEREGQQSSNLLKQVRQDNEGLKKQLEDQKHEVQQRFDDKDREMMTLRKRATEAEEAKVSAERDAAATTKRLVEENSRLTQRLEERERTLGGETDQLKSRVQELEVLVAELQWSEAEVNLQRVVEETTRENDRLKARTQEMIGTMAEQRTTHESRLADLQRQLADLRRDNARLTLATTLNQPRVDASENASEDAPPPAYDDALLVPS